MNKRVCIVRHNYYPEEAHVRRDAETLLQNGYEVDIICLKKKEQKSHEIVRGISVNRLPVAHQRKGVFRYFFEYLAFFLLAFGKLTWLYLKRRYDVIEVDNMPDILVFTTLLPKLLGAKVIFYVFDNMPDYCEEKLMLPANHVIIKILRLIEKASTRWADRIITTQSICKELLQSRGTPGPKISVVLNVPDENVFKACSSPGNNNGEFMLITHGSLIEVYGIQTLIKAVPLLIKDIPGLKIFIVGDGEYRPQLEDLARTLGVSDHFNFTGWVQFEEVPRYISQAHIGIVAVQCKFPALGNKLFEYLALGKPTVVTSIPAIKAYFDDHAVKFFEPDNERDLARCVLELYKNPAERASIAAAGLACYQKYHWPVMKYEYLKVFNQLARNDNSVLGENKAGIRR